MNIMSYELEDTKMDLRGNSADVSASATCHNVVVTFGVLVLVVHSPQLRVASCSRGFDSSDVDPLAHVVHLNRDGAIDMYPVNRKGPCKEFS